MARSNSEVLGHASLGSIGQTHWIGNCFEELLLGQIRGFLRILFALYLQQLGATTYINLSCCMAFAAFWSSNLSFGMFLQH